MICPGKTIATILEEISKMEGGGTWTKRIRHMRPYYMLELGTGQGASGAEIMKSLPPDSRFTTINYDYPADYHFGEMLDPFASDSRLKRINADTVDPETLKLVNVGVDLLFIDTTHEAWVAATELRLFQDKLYDQAIVIVDDLCHNDMMAFWDSIPYEKELDGGQGIFRYVASKRYDITFPRGRTAKENSQSNG